MNNYIQCMVERSCFFVLKGRNYEIFYRFICFEVGVLVGLLLTVWNDINKK